MDMFNQRPFVPWILVFTLSMVSKTLCLAYDEDNIFPQWCGDHELCNALDLIVDVVNSVKAFYAS
jgi:hypothetical protein